jgi:type II secretory ATPase GspE/PulE/Tfp pilus assembly ATPase PilB-like protein
VLATLHTNDAPGAVARLVDMGVESYLLSAALNGVVAQRLARTICGSCSTKYYPSERVLADAGLSQMSGRAFRKGAGCASCHDTGFQGRLGIYETMEVTPEIRRMIYREAPSHELRETLRKNGQLNLREEGVRLALDLRTSLEEVLRVTHNDEEHAAPQAGKPGHPGEPCSETGAAASTPRPGAASAVSGPDDAGRGVAA